MTNSWQTTVFYDCLIHDNQAELLIVEGVSAAHAVSLLRNPNHQAVIAMQGKPMNVMKKSVQMVIENPFFKSLINIIGAGIYEEIDLSKIRYQRIILMMDPDADGIHCNTLMLMFFNCLMQPLLAHKRIFMVRPPVGAIVSLTSKNVEYVYTQTDYRNLIHQGRSQAEQSHQIIQYKGLAGMPSAVLQEKCIQPTTRKLVSLSLGDAQIMT